MTLSQSIQISLCFSITVVYDAKVGKKYEKNFDPSHNSFYSPPEATQRGLWYTYSGACSVSFDERLCTEDKWLRNNSLSRTNEAIAIEVDHMIGCICKPHFSFPRYFGKDDT